MIKARACAGDIPAGDAFLAELRPFVWRKNLDFAAVEDIHSIKRQIHAAKGGSVVTIPGHDVKLGRGGIREIEFFAQTQQLILGGRYPVLRARRTLEAIATAFGAADGALFARIEGLASRGVLPQTLADWAHEVRLVGNTGAHFDPIEDVAVDDAREMLGFLRELMHYLYVLPAELKRRRKGG